MSGEGIGLLGKGLQAIGIVKKGRRDAADLRRQAQAARDQGGRNEETQRREGRQAIGRQAAAMAEAGGGIDEGVVKQSTIAAELDALNIRYGAHLQSSGLLRQARSVKKDSKLLAAATLLGGTSTFLKNTK